LILYLQSYPMFLSLFRCLSCIVSIKEWLDGVDHSQGRVYLSVSQPRYHDLFDSRTETAHYHSRHEGTELSHS
jgi:hypothetical protein